MSRTEMSKVKHLQSTELSACAISLIGYVMLGAQANHGIKIGRF